jgi:hypothetical protein
VKIRALVHSAQWLDRAGVRIRYRRIAPKLEALGASLLIDTIDHFDRGDAADDDVVILSKCTDARAIIVAELLREGGVRVGVDLFDDYFTPRIGPCHGHREFLQEMAKCVDFFLCSTERMRDVAHRFAPGKPAHVLNDPFDRLDADRLAERLLEKSERALAERRLDVLWFGNGDNPIFPVGLTDLAAFGEALRPLANSGFDVRLKVLTNLRALSSENLARIRSLPLPVEIEEWSEEGEARDRDQALVSFLPVNYQNFSTAKSLNRGISALTGGTQILSSGYPLYRAVGDFVYTGAEAILADLEARRLRLRPQTVPALTRCMDRLAHPGNEAARLLAFLRGLSGGSGAGIRLLRTQTDVARAVIHGRVSPSGVHAFGYARGILSIGSAFSNPDRKFDMAIAFIHDPSRLHVGLTGRAVEMVPDELRRRLTVTTSAPGSYSYVLDLPDSEAGRSLRSLHPSMIRSRAGQMVYYGRVMAATEAVCAELLPGTEFLRSEQQSPLMGMAHLEEQVNTARRAFR